VLTQDNCWRLPYLRGLLLADILSCSTSVQRETVRSKSDWELCAALRGTFRAKIRVGRVLRFALNIAAKRSGNEPAHTSKPTDCGKEIRKWTGAHKQTYGLRQRDQEMNRRTQASLRIATRKCSEGVEVQSREFCTSTLDKCERWAEIFFAACVNIPAAYSIILGFESWLRSPLFKMHFTKFYSVSPNKRTDSTWYCVTPLPTLSMVIVYVQIILT
jgi:hypothetical protein